MENITIFIITIDTNSQLKKEKLILKKKKKKIKKGKEIAKKFEKRASNDHFEIARGWIISVTIVSLPKIASFPPKREMDA